MSIFIGYITCLMLTRIFPNVTVVDWLMLYFGGALREFVGLRHRGRNRARMTKRRLHDSQFSIVLYLKKNATHS